MIAVGALFSLWIVAGDVPSMPSRTIAWADLGPATFDLAYSLPDDLAPSSEGRGVAVDLARTMRRLAEDRHADKGGAEIELNCLGDVVRAVREGGGDAAARERVFARVRELQPSLWRDLEPWIFELICDTRFREPRWDPDEDDACDGMVFARPLSMKGRTEPVWKQRDSADLVQQAALLVFADLDAIKAAENDYRLYSQRPGTRYERIGPVADSYVIGVDPAGGDFAALRVVFETDLPFPFTTYGCDLHLLNRIDRRGQLVCDLYSTGEDVHWMAGRDHYFPVQASDGEWIATLVVRWFGFDLRGVPDDDDARRRTMRSSLGGLRRDAERMFRAHGGVPRAIDGSFPAFEVIGKPER
jgi:hypothetical protein